MVHLSDAYGLAKSREAELSRAVQAMHHQQQMRQRYPSATRLTRLGHSLMAVSRRLRGSNTIHQ